MKKAKFGVAYCGSDAKGLPIWKIFEGKKELTKDEIKDLSKEDIKFIGTVIREYRTALQV